MKITKSVVLALTLVTAFCISCDAATYLVHNLKEFDSAVKQLQPGDEVVLAKGIWKDAELVFRAVGTAEKPIILTVEEKGKVTLEGQSNLRISGAYIHIEGLVFKNGWTPTSEVIAFRINNELLANNTRVTQCVIDNYNNPERFESDFWVMIYGKNNRFDHNYLTGKRNQGVTMAVRLNSEASRENNHRIDHNYFGYRPVLGSNGGETLRIGTSHYSMTNSNTLVENNFFYRCNGEHEIISNKSCQNTFRGNTFYECQGTLTMRHGNETLVENNYFFGNGKANTGGIRIINEKQKVINNYCEGLTGYRFRGALVIMNGVPNSPLNRYFQVKDSEASNNTFINCDYIQFCAGSDEERSATPENTIFKNNLIYHDTKNDIFTVYDDISGIQISNNLVSPNIILPKNEGKELDKGAFISKEVHFEINDSGIKVPTNLSMEHIGFQGTSDRATAENTGVNWYPRQEDEVQLGSGNIIPAAPGENTLVEALKKSAPGDIIELQAFGNYLVTKSLDIYHPITFRAIKNPDQKPKILFEKTSLFNIENGGALSLEGLLIDGEVSDDKPGNSVVRTSRYSMINNYRLVVRDCIFENLVVNYGFDVLKIFKNTFADDIIFENSIFRNITGNVIALDKETEDLGIYNVENITVTNCTFEDIEGVGIKLYRGGGDESTFGPIFNLENCTFNQVGGGKRNMSNASIDLHGVQVANIQGNTFQSCAPLKLHLSVGDPVTKISNCSFSNTGNIVSNSDSYQTSNLIFN